MMKDQEEWELTEREAAVSGPGKVRRLADAPKKILDEEYAEIIARRPKVHHFPPYKRGG